MTHKLSLNDAELDIVHDALHSHLRNLQTSGIGIGGTPGVKTRDIINKVKALRELRETAKKTVKIPRSKEDLAREALIAHVEHLFDPKSKSKAAVDFRERFLDGRDDEIPSLKSDMLKDAAKFPKPTDEDWEWDSVPEYGLNFYSGRVGGLHCEISFTKKLDKVRHVMIEVD